MYNTAGLKAALAGRKSGKHPKTDEANKSADKYMKTAATNHAKENPAMKSVPAKKATKGKDFGKKNVPGKTGFKTVEKKAAKEYGSEAAGKRVAGSIFFKMQKRKA